MSQFTVKHPVDEIGWAGASRIGIEMIPRGEVRLVAAKAQQILGCDRGMRVRDGCLDASGSRRRLCPN
jgi:hypothetical protein